MVEKNKIPKELDDKIQSLAGEIYVQIEEKVTKFFINQQKTNEITDEVIEKHPQYQLIADQLNLEKSKNSALETTLNKTKKEFQEKSKSLENTLQEQQQIITNNAEFNEVKLTDTEAALQEKMAENANLLEQVKQLTATNQQQQEQIANAESVTQEQQSQLDTLRDSEKSAQKNAQAKSATLDVQNQQISELQNQLNISLAELAHIKAEQTQNSSSNKLALTEYQQRELAFKKQVEQATKDQKQSKALIDKLHLQLAEVEKTNQALQQNVIEQTEQLHSQEITITTNQQTFDDQIKQLTDAQAENDKFSAEKNAQINALQRDNEKVSTQLETAMASLEESNNKYNEQTKSLTTLKAEHLELQKNNGQLQQTIEQQKQQQAQADAKLTEMQQRIANSEAQHSKNAQALMQLQQSYDNLATSFEQAKQEVDHFQIITENLTKDLEQATKNIEQNQQRYNAQIEKRDKQEVEYSKARDTIKYLRDENAELSQKLENQISELETKLTEYRLRFEYAQKELAKKSL
ncbi:hypothetical protein Q4493_13350 [Colwellia sp. 1_MG-2023]|uniref:hypothetical protein n=1 Tax=Colwellia sp. 1_MG-2023 TaxID=3062649 RepID=UPI0026E3DFAC|nr:hypothetical protein [Colwellia sp. 1_MG-2023]MDO6446764.1 hypothetical protein [Colwellia sp. 1_MG-2023]